MKQYYNDKNYHGGIKMNNENAVGYKEFINVIKRGKWIILLITVLITTAAALISFYSMKGSKPAYQTKTSLIIGRQADIINAKGFISTYEQIANSSSIAKNASVLLKGTVPVLKIKNSYNILVAADAPILTITTTGDTQKQSSDIANAITTSFSKQVKIIYPTETVKIMEVQNDLLNSKFKVMNVVLAFLLGLFLSIFIVTFIGFFDEKIRTKNDVEKYLGLPVLGNLPNRRRMDI